MAIPRVIWEVIDDDTNEPVEVTTEMLGVDTSEEESED